LKKTIEEVVMRKAVLSAGLLALVSYGYSESGMSHYEFRYVKEFKEKKELSVAYASGGRIEGKVVYTGSRKLTNKKKLITKDKEVCGRGYKVDEVYVISPSGGVKNAVVFVEGRSDRKSPVRVKLTQERCEFKPRVVVLTRGSELTIINLDSVKHEANGVQDFETIFQLSQPSKGMKDSVKLENAGVVEITCNIHGWMKAWAVVVDSDFYDITDSEGRFSINNLPAGEYTLRVWHEGFGEKKLKVKVGEGKTSNVSIEFN
jgi:plastocyanin